MDRKNNHDFVRRIFKTTEKSYDFMVKITTFWEDTRWKKRILKIADLCENPQTILDLACGTGILTFALAQKFPNSKVVGIDLQEEYLTYARAKQVRDHVKNVEFYEKSAEDTSEGEYDLITASYLPKYVNLNLIISNCSKMLRPGGLLIFHDFTYPEDPLYKFFYHVYWLFLKPVLWLLKPWREISRELEGLIAKTKWVDDLQEALHHQGFTRVHVEVQRFQVAAIVYATKLTFQPKGDCG